MTSESRRIDSKTVASVCQITNTVLQAIEVSRARLSATFLTARFQARADMDCGALAPSWYSPAPANAASTHATIPPIVVISVRLAGKRPAAPMNATLGSRTPANQTASPAHTAVFGPAP